MGLPNILDVFMPRRDDSPDAGFFPTGDNSDPSAPRIKSLADLIANTRQEGTSQPVTTTPDASTFTPMSQPQERLAEPDNAANFYPASTNAAPAPDQNTTVAPTDSSIYTPDTSPRPRLAPSADGDITDGRYDVRDPNNAPVTDSTAIGHPAIEHPDVTMSEHPVPLDKDTPRNRAERMAQGELPDKGHWWQRALKGGLQGFAAGGLGGAIAGAGIEGFYPKAYQNMEARNFAAQDAPKLAYLDAQEKAKNDEEYRQDQLQQKKDTQKAISDRQMQGFANRVKIHQQDADVKAGKAQLFIDEDGKVWKQFLQADSTGHMRPNEPVVNPTTGEQDTRPGEQGVDWKDPLTGNIIRAKGKQVLLPGATIAGANAQRTQQGEEYNATQRRLIDEENAKSLEGWQKETNEQKNAWMRRKTDQAMKAAEANTSTDTEGIRQQMQNAKDQTEHLDSIGAFNSKEYLQAQDSFWQLNKQFQDALAKQANGQQKVKAMQDVLEPEPTYRAKPTPRSYPKEIQPAQVGGGITRPAVPKNKDPLGLYK